MRRFVLILMLLVCCGSVCAQTGNKKGKVTVSVVDAETKEGVQGAVVEVAPVNSPDEKRYYTTGYGGKVEISSLAYGEYKAVTSFLGYADLESTFKVSAATQDLGQWLLAESATRIDAVVKEVKALRTSQDGDTLSYNAGAFKVANDADVEGLLKKMPGITVNNGEVEAQGETVKKIFVDGKEFFGEDVSTAIKSLPAQAVDRIEVYNKLSDQAEFSGMDDGEGYKAINIVTHPGMRQGQFGKLYAGYGYQPQTDDVTSHHKYIVGGNVNFFQGDSRISLLGLFNNINQQNFSFEDILGVSGQGGQGGVGQYMVRPQSGVASVNALGINYSDQWGKKDQVKFQGSYFFNNTSTKNLSRNDTWYESPAPVDTLYKRGYSSTRNGNHRLNARIDWTISETQSLMSRTGFSYQGNTPFSRTTGYQFGESGLLYLNDYGRTSSHGWNVNEFLQYRVRLGKPGRTLTVDGSFRYNSNDRKRTIASNDATALPYGSDEYDEYRDVLGYDERHDSGYTVPALTGGVLYDPLFQYITSPSRSYNIRGSVAYTEPLNKNWQLNLSYRIGYQDSNRDQTGYFTDSNFAYTDKDINPEMTNAYRSGYLTHNVGPGVRYSKDKNTFVANVTYQRSSLDGSVVGGQSAEVKKDFNNVMYFAMANYAFNRENTVRIFFRSSTNAPSVNQLQDIYDVSTPQYLSVGNKDLVPSYNHSINFHYVNSNVEKGRTFMWMFSMNTQQNYISGSTWYTGGAPIDVNGETYTPQRVTSYENMDGYWALRTHVSLGVPLSFMKCNLNIMAGVNYNINPSAIYESYQDMLDHVFTANKAKNIGYDLNVTLGSNISENIDFTVSWNGGYNQAWNTAALTGSRNKNNYFNHTASASLKWVFWKGFTFTGNCSYVQYLGFTNHYNESYVLCNLYIGKKVFKNQLGEVQLGVNDVANQNKAFGRATGSGYTQNSWNSVIGRYYSIQFVYNLRHFGKKGSTSAKDYDYNESSSAVGMGRSGGGGGMRPMGPPPGMR